MVNVMPIVKGLAVQGIVRGLSSPPSTPAGLGLILVSVVPAGVGLGFLSYSEFLFLQTHYTPDLAAFLTALTALAISVALGFGGYHALKKRKSRAQHLDKELIESIHSLIENITNDIEDPIRENPAMAVLLASVAGFIAGDHLPGRA